jgi:hypothetical protein
MCFWYVLCMYLYVNAGPNQKGERALGKDDCSKQTKKVRALVWNA